MTTTPGHRLHATAPTGLRRLGVLPVLAGVLAMHGLAGGSHLAMASAARAGGRPAVSATAGEVAAPELRLMADVNLMAGMAPAHGGAARQAGTVPTPRAAASASLAAPRESGVQTACLAVLLGLSLLGARAAAGVPGLLHTLTADGAGHSSAPLGRGPPRQLLAQLCVLRT